MQSYAVLTDSACDLPKELAERHHIDILCFKIALDGEGYTERVDFTAEQFCDMLRKTDGLPTTSQVNQYEFEEQFERYYAQGVKQVLYISICASGSGTNAAAHAAAERFAEAHPDSGMRIDIVDSHCYSMGYGEQVIEAEEMLAAGKPIEEILAYLEDTFARREILLAAYTLKIIRKSGRISAAAAIAGGLLGIHPVFTLNDGASEVVAKVRGEKHVVAKMVQEFAGRADRSKPYFIGVANHQYEQEYVEACTQAVGYAPKLVFHLGCAVCSNTGPEAVGIIYQGQKRER